MVILRPKGLKPSIYSVSMDALRLPEGYQMPCFSIHPATSELAESLVIDSSALDDERYSGIYDESGDYVPQYAENPEDIPQGAMVANPEEKTPPASSGGTEDLNGFISSESPGASPSGDTK